MLRLITTRRCTTECFAMAGEERALLRFVNGWSMTGAFRRRSFRSGPHRDGGRAISAAFGDTLLFHGERGDRASPECAQDVPGEQDGLGGAALARSPLRALTGPRRSLVPVVGVLFPEPGRGLDCPGAGPGEGGACRAVNMAHTTFPASPGVV